MWDLTLRLEHIAGSGSKELQSSAIAKSWVAQLSGDTGFRNHSILEVDEEWNCWHNPSQALAKIIAAHHLIQPFRVACEWACQCKTS